MKPEKLVASLRELLTKAKPYLLMIGLQFGMAGNYIFGKDVLNHGMSRFVFIVYRNAMATIALLPFAFIFERRIRPKMTLPVFLQIFVLGFLEPVFNQNFTYLGMKYTSATFTSAIVNSVPSITFVLAVIMRLECVRIRELRSQAKVIGTLVTLGGALLMAMYKGPGFNLFHSSESTRQEHEAERHSQSSTSEHPSQAMGTLFIMMGCVALSAFYVLQSITVKRYPAELSLATWICFFGGIQGTAVALVAEPHSRVWAIAWDYRLYAPLYTGIVSSGIAYSVQGVVMKMRGPVFATAFNPLCMIVVAALGSLTLGEQLRPGSIIGGIIIALGLYSVVWGKAKDYSSTGDIQGLPTTITATADIKTDTNGAGNMENKVSDKPILEIPINVEETDNALRNLCAVRSVLINLGKIPPPNSTI